MSESFQDLSVPVLRRFLQTASSRAEQAAATVRAAVIVAVAARLVIWVGDEMLAGTLKHWMTLGVLLIGLGVSEAIRRQIRSRAYQEQLLVASTLLDALLAFFAVLPSVVSPRPEYLGVLAAPDVMIWPLVALAAGFRLSERAALLGSLAATMGLGALVIIDQALNRDILLYEGAAIVLAALFMGAAVAASVQFARRQRRLVREGAQAALSAEQVRSRFGAYMSPEIAQMVLQQRTVEPGGTTREVAILFSDLRGFTRYGEELGPDALIRELNAYLDAMVEAIDFEGGAVDKYVGDAIMAVFGLPAARGDEACRAIRAAAAMEAALVVHNGEREALGLPPLAQGIGVHFGSVVAGNVGTRERVQFTVIGDTVNVASRLESATKEAGTTVLFSAELVERARAEGGALPPLSAMPALGLRGRQAHTDVFGLAEGG